MVKDGKIKREDLDMVKRWESLYANAVENYPLFVGGVVSFELLFCLLFQGSQEPWEKTIRSIG